MTIAAEPRIVEATEEHVPFIAWVALEAFRSHLPQGFWDFMLHDLDEAGKLRQLEALVATEQRHWSHYSTFLVAEVEGQPVSALCAYFEEELGGREREDRADGGTDRGGVRARNVDHERRP